MCQFAYPANRRPKNTIKKKTHKPSRMMWIFSLNKTCLPCLIITQSCYFDYRISKPIARSRGVICVSCSVHVISAWLRAQRIIRFGFCYWPTNQQGQKIRSRGKGSMPSTHSLPSLTDPSDEQRRLGDDFCDEINRSSGSSACLAYCTSQKRDLTIYPLLKVITITSCLASGVSRQNKISSRLTSRASRYSTTSSRIDLVAHSVAHN